MANTEAMAEKISADEQRQATKPFGPVTAAFYAVGIGSILLGLFTTLAEANETIADKLQLSDRVGPLSGKTIFAVIIWAVSWAILHLVLRDKDPAPRKVFTWTGVMVAIGIVLTFPIFFQLFAAE